MLTLLLEKMHNTSERQSFHRNFLGIIFEHFEKHTLEKIHKKHIYIEGGALPKKGGFDSLQI